MISIILVITAVCGFIPQWTIAEQKTRVVELPFGNIRGYTNDKSWQFNGIPFAKPPVGDLRWKNPEDFVPFPNQTLDAKNPKPICPQDCKHKVIPAGCPDQISEDCLYLNIFIPLSWNQNSKERFSVLLYIYGGSFDHGSAGNKLLDGRYLSSHTDTIVVTFNYRVGALGFLRHPLLGVSGNMGFMDQRKAMEWVNKYITYFGGDNKKIALFGESAGGISVGIHMVSKNSQPLFQRAIIESNPWTVPLHHRFDADGLGMIFSTFLGCVTKECIQSEKTWENIIDAQNKILLSFTWPLNALEAALVWGPIVDGKELIDQPFNLMLQLYKTGNNHKPVIMGTTADEGYTFLVKYFNKCKWKICQKSLYFLLMVATFGEHFWNVDKKYNYLYGPTKDYFQRASRVLRDFAFGCPNRYLSNEIAKAIITNKSQARVYNYIWNAGSVIPHRCPGLPCHTVDLQYVFDTVQFANASFNPDQKAVSSLVQTYWGNMAKTGNPDSEDPSSNTATTWSPYGEERFQMLFETPSSHQIKDYADERAVCDFFDKIGYNRTGIFFLHHDNPNNRFESLAEHAAFEEEEEE